jgi:hypothetical protein
MYAVDSLRQLSHGFLAKGELLNCAFERESLKPYDDDLMGPHLAHSRSASSSWTASIL